MNLKQMLLVIGCIIFGFSPRPGFPAPVPKDQPVFTCTLTVTGKIGELKCSDGSEVVITNRSIETLDIGTPLGPLGNLDIKMKDPKGQAVKADPLAFHLSPLSSEAIPHLLKPGESFTATLGLLFAVPEEKRIEGTYKVKAVFTFNKKDYESAEVEVKWPGNKK